MASVAPALTTPNNVRSMRGAGDVGDVSASGALTWDGLCGDVSNAGGDGGGEGCGPGGGGGGGGAAGNGLNLTTSIWPSWNDAVERSQRSRHCPLSQAIDPLLSVQREVTSTSPASMASPREWRSAALTGCGPCGVLPCSEESKVGRLDSP